MTYTVGHYIGGSRTDGGERRIDIFQPATGRVQGSVQIASREVVSDAVRIASAAQRKWCQVGSAKRARVMFKLRELIEARTEELAAIISREHGKIRSDAVGEVARGLENVEFCAGLVHHMKGEAAEQVAAGIDVLQRRQALGVVGCITPFNFPAMVPLWMVTTAIAAGNSVVLKPSERDPSPAIWIAEAFSAAGLPEGVLNVVNGDKETVEALLEAPEVRAISFVGSTPIAKRIYEAAATRGKRVQALGSAKNHMVVMPDADLEAAADAAVSAAYGSAGERCMAVSIVVVVGEIADELVEKISARVQTLQVGDPSDPLSDMGPLISQAARERVLAYLEHAAAEGATIVVDGRTQQLPPHGFFVGATLLDHVKPGMRVYDDEIFGPVLSIVRVESFDQAIALVNANSFANGTAIFTRDGRSARQFETLIEVGMVGINVPIPVPIGAFSFGGWKESLFGDTHMYGPESFNFYTRRKVVTSKWTEASESQLNLEFPTNV